jgi:uncharacterized protein YhfF
MAEPKIIREQVLALVTQRGVALAPTCRISAFGDSAFMAAKLGRLVAAGKKTATSSLLWDWEADCEPIPAAGEAEILVEWSGIPYAVIRTTDVRIVPFHAVPEDFASAEGEGDGSLEWWRTTHWECFGKVCARIKRTATSEMPVVCQRFTMVHDLLQLESKKQRV